MYVMYNWQVGSDAGPPAAGGSAAPLQPAEADAGFLSARGLHEFLLHECDGAVLPPRGSCQGSLGNYVRHCVQFLCGRYVPYIASVREICKYCIINGSYIYCDLYLKVILRLARIRLLFVLLTVTFIIFLG